MMGFYDFKHQKGFVSLAEKYQYEWWLELVYQRQHHPDLVAGNDWFRQYRSLMRVPIRPTPALTRLGQAARTWQKALRRGNAWYVEPSPFL